MEERLGEMRKGRREQMRKGAIAGLDPGIFKRGGSTKTIPPIISY